MMMRLAVFYFDFWPLAVANFVSKPLFEALAIELAVLASTAAEFVVLGHIPVAVVVEDFVHYSGYSQCCLFVGKVLGTSFVAVLLLWPFPNKCNKFNCINSCGNSVVCKRILSHTSSGFTYLLIM